MELKIGHIYNVGVPLQVISPMHAEFIYEQISITLNVVGPNEAKVDFIDYANRLTSQHWTGHLHYVLNGIEDYLIGLQPIMNLAGGIAVPPVAKPDENIPKLIKLFDKYDTCPSCGAAWGSRHKSDCEYAIVDELR